MTNLELDSPLSLSQGTLFVDTHNKTNALIMEDTLSQLLKLQELGITKKEVNIVHGNDGEEMTKIDQDIKDIRESVDVDSLARYDRLSTHGLAVVTLNSGMCMGCNMTIPVGDINRMMADNNKPPTCPHCARFVIL